MQIKEMMAAYEEKLKKVESLATKAANNTEKYYWEVKELRSSVSELITVSKQLFEALSALLKIQIGD